MKKLIFLSLFGVLFLAGCKNMITSQGIDVHITDMDGNIISYTVPSHVFPGSYTGVFKKSPLFVQYPDNKEAMLMMGHGTMTGNAYTYSFPDVGMTITFADDAASYFNPQDPAYFEPFMFYTGNTAFYGKPTNNYNQFIAVFSKDTTSTLKDVIEKDHSLLLKDGCVPKLREGELSILSGSENEYEVYNLEKKDSETCMMGTFFVMNKANSDRYYLLSFADACAPSCNTFTHVELK